MPTPATKRGCHSTHSYSYLLRRAVQVNPKLDILSPKTEAAYQAFMDKKNPLTHLLVYGTLRKNSPRNWNYSRFGPQKFVCEVRLDGYVMHSLGGYPAVCPGKGSITCELHEVSPETEKSITRMEQGAGYAVDTHDVKLPDGGTVKAGLYAMSPERMPYRSQGLIPTGDWANA